MLKNIFLSIAVVSLLAPTENLFAGEKLAKQILSKESRPVGPCVSQRKSGQRANRPAKVDEQGVLRWKDTGEEVALFGVNYTVPFAYSYRAHSYLGISHKQAIDKDVYHFARMGLDVFRLHLWDQEISDQQGNLVDNEHLQLLDYLIYKLKSYGIYSILTPITGNRPGYPEPSPPTNGFSNRYNKAQLGSDPIAIKKQQNYLAQLANHINRYTSLAYKDDPAIICFELNNEPAPQSEADTRKYINALAKSIQDTGCGKPLFYNASQWMHPGLVAAIRDSTVNGSSFGWYPTGLVAGRPLRGNCLPKLNFPQLQEPQLDGKAKMVYEFDAADVAGSYMYPAMVRVFRQAGVQMATMFAYDPLEIAYSNTEYYTHYINLAYTPNKAVSLMIAAEAFRRLPRLKSYGKYPENNRFGPFRVSYEQDLSEMVTERELLYSNNTRTKPPKPKNLQRVVGCGSSPVVSYEGTGSYFLEKLEAGVWRLEVYPDAIWVSNPYATPSLDRQVGRILWRRWPMRINLPDLGQSFTVRPINKDNTFNTKTENGTFSIRPGVYLLKRKGVTSSAWKASTPFGLLLLGEFIAPAERKKPTVMLHEPSREIVENRAWTVSAKVVSSNQPDKVTLYTRRANARKFRRFTSRQMNRRKGYEYTVKIPASKIKPGLIEYAIAVQEGKQVRTFPANVTKKPSDWDFGNMTLWQTRVVKKQTPVILFDASRDRDKLYFPNREHSVSFSTEFTTSAVTGRLALRIGVPDFSNYPHDVSGRYIFGKDLESRRRDLGQFDTLRLRIRAAKKATSYCEIILIEKDSSAWAAIVPLSENWREILVPITDLRPTIITDLPRPYPTILDYWQKDSVSRAGKDNYLRISNIEAIQFSLGARLFPDHADRPHAIEIENVSLEKSYQKII